MINIPTANTQEEWRELLSSSDPNIARSREDWNRFVADDQRRGTMLPNCDEKTIQAFSDGLTFNNGGLAHADFSMLEDRLTMSDFFNLMNNFGIGRKLLTDYFDYKCDGNHTCVWSPGSICTSNC
jgi:hypothetical protein